MRKYLRAGSQVVISSSETLSSDYSSVCQVDTQKHPLQKLKLISLKSRTRQCCPLSSHLFNLLLETLARANKKTEEDQGNKNWKERNQSIDTFRQCHNIRK